MPYTLGTLKVAMCGGVCVCACTFAVVIWFSHVAGAENLHMYLPSDIREGTKKQKCVKAGGFLFLHTPQTNSLCCSTVHQMCFIFLKHICRNQFWDAEEPGFVCLGQDGAV